MIVNDVLAKIYGASLSGFGFSLGRGVYKKTKSNIDGLLLSLVFILMVVLVLLGTVFAGIFLVRNYRSVFTTLLVRLLSIAAIIMLGILPAAVSTPHVQLPEQIAAYTENVVVQLLLLGPVLTLSVLKEIVTSLFSLSVEISKWAPWAIVGFLLAIGILIGLIQRSQRRKAWRIEEANVAFLAEYGLSQTLDDGLIDTENQAYRLDSFAGSVNGGRAMAEDG